jgi:hypothetical protein
MDCVERYGIIVNTAVAENCNSLSSCTQGLLQGTFSQTTNLKAVFSSPPCGVLLGGHVNDRHDITHLRRERARDMEKKQREREYINTGLHWDQL